MPRFFRRRPKAAAARPEAEHNPLEQSAETAPPSTESFPLGIKLLHSAAHATVEYVHFDSKLQQHSH